MALDRKDVRAYLDPDWHRALRKICEVDNVEIGSFLEELIVAAIRKRLHGVIELAAEAERLGISRDEAESSGERK